MLAFSHALLPTSTSKRHGAKVLGWLRDDGRTPTGHHTRTSGEAIT